MLSKVYNHSAVFKFRKFSILYYGAYFSIGFLCFMCSYWFLSRVVGINLDNVFFWYTSLGYCLSFAIGTKLLRLYKSREKFLKEPWSVLKKNGNSFYGGVFGFVAAAYFLSLQPFSLTFLENLDLVALSLPFFQIFIRLGCASYGCCFGKPCDTKNGIIYYDANSPAYKLHGSRPLLPTQSYSIYKNIFLVIFLYVMFFVAPFPGLSVALWCIGYSVLRFFLDYTRDDTNKEKQYGLRKSQYISMLVFSIGVFCLFFVKNVPYYISVDFDLFFEDIVGGVSALITSFIIFFIFFSISLVITNRK